MNNTEKSFNEKWHNNSNLAFENTLNEDSEIFNWILNRNGFNISNDLKIFLKNKSRILDAGCGNGRVTALLREYSDASTSEVVGIDLVAADIAKKNLNKYSNTSFYKKNLLDDLSDLGLFDFIYCQEVLHHTDNPRKSFDNLVSLLKEGGEIAIYVYKEKAPIREYVDDFIRGKINQLSYEDALKHCRQITEFGKVLSDLNLKINIPNVDLLEIQAGEYDLQRIFYHFFIKCFWNNEFSFEDNAVINYDWYHPQNCTRHTLNEIREWFNDNGLKINHEFVDYYGITMKGTK
jgi:SAM-dependent methyltransferase